MIGREACEIPQATVREYLGLKPLIDDNLLLILDSSEDRTIYYAQTEVEQSAIDFETQNLTLISYWSRVDPSTSSEYECTDYIAEANIIKYANKALFTSDNGQVYFFSDNEGRLSLNMLNDNRRNNVSRYQIAQNSKLEHKLRY